MLIRWTPLRHNPPNIKPNNESLRQLLQVQEQNSLHLQLYMVQAPNPSPPMVMGLRILPPSNAALELQQLRRGAFSGKGGWSTVANHKGFTKVKNLGLVTLVGLTNNNPCLFLFFLEVFSKEIGKHRYWTWKCLNMGFSESCLGLAGQDVYIHFFQDQIGLVQHRGSTSDK